METQLSPSVPSAQSRMWSMAAEAADAALDAPRALMMAAPRCWTVWNEIAFVPVLIDPIGFQRRLSGHQGLVQVRVLGRGMIAPDGHLLDAGVMRAGFRGQLSHRAIVVQAGHRGEVFRRQVGRIGLSNQRVGIGRVAYDQYLDIPAGHGVQGLALRAKDLAVLAQQVGPFHAGGRGVWLRPGWRSRHP